MSLIYQQFSRPYETDKHADFTRVYNDILTPLFEQSDVAILELGIDKGGSLKLWAEYLQQARVFGVDLELPQTDFPPNVELLVADQADGVALRAGMAAWGCDRFDVIMDDAAHIGWLSAASFGHLFHDHLKPGGAYVIEDWGTGYWHDWIDGERPAPLPDLTRDTRATTAPPYDKAAQAHVIRSHQAGMVGFVKLLIDVMSRRDVLAGAPDLIVPDLAIASIEFRPGIVVVRKAV